GVRESSAPLIAVERPLFERQVGDQNVGQAVVIVIGKDNAHAREGLAIIGKRHAGVQGLFFEGTVAAVVEQELFHQIVVDKDIGKTVAVVVVKRDSHSFAGYRRDPGGCAYVSKVPVAFVMEEEIRRTPVFFGPAVGLKRCAADQVSFQVIVQIAGNEQ